MRKKLIPFVAFAFVLAAYPLKMQKAEDLACFPAVEYASGEIEGYVSELQNSEGYVKALAADAVTIRTYTDTVGRSFSVAVVIGSGLRTSIHRPELCLTGQNFFIQKAWTETIAGRGWRREVISRTGTPPSAFAYRFFNQDGFETPSYAVRHFVDIWDRAFRRRIDRWVFVSVTASTDDAAALNEFIARLP